MKADYLDAHQRHWSDAEYLLQAERWANADHLFGVAAECGLKQLMLLFGMPYDTAKDKPSFRDDAKHADGIWNRYEAYRSGHLAGTGYGLPNANPFAGWDVSQRYAHHSHFNQALAKSHRDGAWIVCGLVTKAQQEGLL